MQLENGRTLVGGRKTAVEQVVDGSEKPSSERNSGGRGHHRTPAREQLEKKHARRVHIGRGPHSPAFPGLRRDVRRDVASEAAAHHRGKHRVGEAEPPEPHLRIDGNRHEPGPQQAVADRLSVLRREPCVLESGADAFGDQESERRGKGGPRRAQAQQHGVERPAGAFVPRAERRAVGDGELRLLDDRFVGKMRDGLSVTRDRRKNRGRRKLRRLKDAQPNETLLVCGVQRAKNRSEAVFTERRHQEMGTDASRLKRSCCHDLSPTRWLGALRRNRASPDDSSSSGGPVAQGIVGHCAVNPSRERGSGREPARSAKKHPSGKALPLGAGC